MNARLFSDEIRERERRRRRRGVLWGVASFVLHAAIFSAIVFMAPLKSLDRAKARKKANPAADLPAERIEQISDALSRARINELLKQLEALQTVLHNMDLMKEELQKDYDAFAGMSAESSKEAIKAALDEVEKAQAEASAEQAPVIARVERMLAEERLDLRDVNRSQWLHDEAIELKKTAGEKVADAQARAGNALDRIQVQAEFAGYRRTAEASAKVRDAQIDATAMHNQAQEEASEIGAKMGEMRQRALALEQHEKWLANEKERLAKIEANRKALQDALEQAKKERASAGGGGNGGA